MRTVLRAIEDARLLAAKAREFKPVAGSLFGGHHPTAQDLALADAVDRLAAVCEVLVGWVSARPNTSLARPDFREGEP